MKKISLFIGMMLSVMHASYAADTDVNFSGTLIKGGCVINNGQPINIDFGDITGNLSGINTVLSVRYQKEVAYTVDCPTGVTNNAMKIKIDGNLGNGTVASNNGNVLATTKSDLGILLTKTTNGYVGDAAIKLGEWNNFDYPDLMKVYATPVTTGDVSGNIGNVSGGDFSATATMHVEYQ